jgi:hypothetical protein
MAVSSRACSGGAACFAVLCENHINTDAFFFLLLYNERFVEVSCKWQGLLTLLLARYFLQRFYKVMRLRIARTSLEETLVTSDRPSREQLAASVTAILVLL